MSESSKDRTGRDADRAGVATLDPTLDPARRAGGRPRGIPFWGAIAVPAGALWGPVLGGATGAAFGNVLIGAAIGAALGIGIGLSLFAAAIVVASARF